MKNTLLYIFLLCIQTSIYGRITSPESVCVSIIYGNGTNGYLYVDMKDDDIFIKANAILSLTKEDMDRRLLCEIKNECRLKVPQRISRYLKKNIEELFISHNQNVYSIKTGNGIFFKKADFTLKANIQKNNGDRYEIHIPLLDSKIEENIKYSPAFNDFIQTIHYLFSIAMEGLFVSNHLYIEPTCNSIYDMVKLKFESIPNGNGLDITVCPTTVSCSVESPFNSPNETRYYGDFDITCYHTSVCCLSHSEENYIRSAVEDFFITQSIPIYSIRRKVSDESFAYDAFSDYLNWIIYSGNCTKHVDMYLASAYKMSTTQIENYEISYSDQFMRFLQFLFYLKARTLGGEHMQWYKNDIGRMKKDQKYHVYEFRKIEEISK